jgi:hypothetical protein
MQEIIQYLMGKGEEPESLILTEEVTEVDFECILGEVFGSSFSSETQEQVDNLLSRMTKVLSLDANESFRLMIFNSLFGEPKLILSCPHILESAHIRTIAHFLYSYIMNNHTTLEIEAILYFIPITSSLESPSLLMDILIENCSVALVEKFLVDYKKIYEDYYIRSFRENEVSMQRNGFLKFPLLKSSAEREEEFIEYLAYKIFFKAAEARDSSYVGFFDQLADFRKFRAKDKESLKFEMEKSSLRNWIANSRFVSTGLKEREFLSKIITVDSFILFKYQEHRGLASFCKKS